MCARKCRFGRTGGEVLLENADLVEQAAKSYLERTDIFFARRQAMAKFASRCTGKTIPIDGRSGEGPR